MSVGEQYLLVIAGRMEPRDAPLPSDEIGGRVVQ